MTGWAHAVFCDAGGRDVDEFCNTDGGHVDARAVAPEEWLGGIPSVAGDVYRLGLSMWESLTQVKAWSDLDRGAIRRKVLDGSRPPLDAHPQLRKSLNAYGWGCIADMIMACWHPEPSSRPSLNNIITVLDTPIQKRSLVTPPKYT